jgi:hypothetical protein
MNVPCLLSRDGAAAVRRFLCAGVIGRALLKYASIAPAVMAAAASPVMNPLIQDPLLLSPTDKREQTPVITAARRVAVLASI